MTSLLKGVIFDPGGTGGAARSIGRPAAAKTGTTSSYYDTWFMGYTPQIITGVWAGFDSEKSLGVGETGGKTALPIWLEYMKAAHEDLPRLDFNIPDKIVFANIDNATGKLASATSKEVVRQAFLEGTEPNTSANDQGSSTGVDKDFFKDDLSQ
jgi:penicillin-binding protein 1A